jgi:dTDP-glucose 4,6-dehydratase
MKQSILLLTGCAGFIGLNFLEYLSEHINEFKEKIFNFNRILLIDKMGYATVENNIKYFKIADTIGETIQVSHFFENIINGLNYQVPENSDVFIINFASESHVDNSIKSPYSFYIENVLILPKLFEFIATYKLNLVKFIHTSTDEIYGDLELDDKNYFTLNSNYNTSSPYSASKAAQDLFLKSLVKTFHINAGIFRYTNQYGEYQHSEKMIPKTINAILNDAPVKIYGNGKNIRQWCYVKETIQSMFTYLEKNVNTPWFEINITSNIEENLIDNNTLVDLLYTIFNEDLNIKKERKIEYVTDRLGHDKKYAVVGDFYIEKPNTLRLNLKNTIEFYIEKKKG